MLFFFWGGEGVLSESVFHVAKAQTPKIKNSKARRCFNGFWLCCFVFEGVSLATPRSSPSGSRSRVAPYITLLYLTVVRWGLDSGAGSIYLLWAAESLAMLVARQSRPQSPSWPSNFMISTRFSASPSQTIGMIGEMGIRSEIGLLRSQRLPHWKGFRTPLPNGGQKDWIRAVEVVWIKPRAKMPTILPRVNLLRPLLACKRVLAGRLGLARRTLWEPMLNWESNFVAGTGSADASEKSVPGGESSIATRALSVWIELQKGPQIVSESNWVSTSLSLATDGKAEACWSSARKRCAVASTATSVGAAGIALFHTPIFFLISVFAASVSCSSCVCVSIASALRIWVCKSKRCACRLAIAWAAFLHHALLWSNRCKAGTLASMIDCNLAIFPLTSLVASGIPMVSRAAFIASSLETSCFKAMAVMFSHASSVAMTPFIVFLPIGCSWVTEALGGTLVLGRSSRVAGLVWPSGGAPTNPGHACNFCNLGS